MTLRLDNPSLPSTFGPYLSVSRLCKTCTTLQLNHTCLPRLA